jgi:hypothetical protein
VIEPTGARFLRWQGRIEGERRWGSTDPWRRHILHPDRNRCGDWVYAFTRKGLARNLNKWLARRAAEQARQTRREEVVL